MRRSINLKVELYAHYLLNIAFLTMSLLKAFSFNIEDNMLKADLFIYENFTLSRNYEYESDLLKEVEIFIKDREGNILFQFREVFELE